MKYILFPLGNPGEKYSETRHNAGRFVINNLKKDLNFQKLIEDNNIHTYIPDSFMNESGKSLKEFIKNKNIPKENIIVVYDDKDLEIGNVRLSINKNDGGHNGIKNIIEYLTGKDFYRIRIGIAPKGTGRDGLIPPHGDIVQKYVLAKLTKEEKEILSSDRVLDRVLIFLEEIINNDKK